MPKYAIKHQTVTKPEIELPEGSQVVSVEFWKNIGWQVVWLEVSKFPSEQQREG